MTPKQAQIISDADQQDSALRAIATKTGMSLQQVTMLETMRGVIMRITQLRKEIDALSDADALCLAEIGIYAPRDTKIATIFAQCAEVGIGMITLARSVDSAEHLLQLIQSLPDPRS
jgi:hypothetical protein